MGSAKANNKTDRNIMINKINFDSFPIIFFAASALFRDNEAILG